MKKIEVCGGQLKVELRTALSDEETGDAARLCFARRSGASSKLLQGKCGGLRPSARAVGTDSYNWKASGFQRDPYAEYACKSMQSLRENDVDIRHGREEAIDKILQEIRSNHFSIKVADFRCLDVCANHCSALSESLATNTSLQELYLG